MKKTILAALFLLSGMTASAQFGFGGFQMPQVELECSEKFIDVNYAGDDQAYHNLDIYLPKTDAKKFPVVVHIYGSAWFSNSSKGMADLGTIVNALLKAGYAVVCPNHRSSSDAKFPAQINDIKAVIRFIRGNADKYKFDTSFIATSGFSSGGHLSTLTATSGNVKSPVKVGKLEVDLEGKVGNYLKESSAVNACCDWSGPIDMFKMNCDEPRKWGGTPEEALVGHDYEDQYADNFKSISAITYIDKNDPPTIIFHGTDDNVVPCCQGQELYDELTKVGVKSSVTIVPGGGHGFNMYGDDNLKKMVDFLNDVRLKK
ncbi:MAG: alpha/beta hydrolase [Bacteroidaceae bacterium]|nr:alpha/beta hydrolase [Bacteroidaceae bacterium]